MFFNDFIGKTTTLIGFVALAAHTHAAPVLDLDFTAAEGFSDGAPINNIQDMNAQPNWVAGDTAGTGYATSVVAWNRARNYANYTLATNEAVVIETILRLTDADGTYSDADNFKIGFAENSVHSGADTPSIGSTLHTFADGSYWFGGNAADNRINIGAADSGDWIKFTQVISRSATVNEFTGSVSATNLTKGTDLGKTASDWTASTTDGSWDGTMRPSFRSWANAQATALEIDRWTVYTITNTVTPPPPTPADHH